MTTMIAGIGGVNGLEGEPLVCPTSSTNVSAFGEPMTFPTAFEEWGWHAPAQPLTSWPTDPRDPRPSLSWN